MSGKSLFSKDVVSAMPTIHQGQYANMKIETENHRIWLCRVEDVVIVEQLQDGKWVTVEKYS